MPDHEHCGPADKRTLWNKGKLIGARPPLRPKHVWAIRTRLLLEGRIRDLALFIPNQGEGDRLIMRRPSVVSQFECGEGKLLLVGIKRR